MEITDILNPVVEQPKQTQKERLYDALTKTLKGKKKLAKGKGTKGKGKGKKEKESASTTEILSQLQQLELIRLLRNLKRGAGEGTVSQVGTKVGRGGRRVKTTFTQPLRGTGFKGASDYLIEQEEKRRQEEERKKEKGQLQKTQEKIVKIEEKISEEDKKRNELEQQMSKALKEGWVRIPILTDGNSQFSYGDSGDYRIVPKDSEVYRAYKEAYPLFYYEQKVMFGEKSIPKEKSLSSLKGKKTITSLVSKYGDELQNGSFTDDDIGLYDDFDTKYNQLVSIGFSDAQDRPKLRKYIRGLKYSGVDRELVDNIKESVISNLEQQQQEQQQPEQRQQQSQ